MVVTCWAGLEIRPHSRCRCQLLHSRCGNLPHRTGCSFKVDGNPCANLVKTVRKEITSHVQVDTGPVAAAELVRPTGGEEDVHLCLVVVIVVNHEDGGIGYEGEDGNFA